MSQLVCLAYRSPPRCKRRLNRSESIRDKEKIGQQVPGKVSRMPDGAPSPEPDPALPTGPPTEDSLAAGRAVSGSGSNGTEENTNEVAGTDAPTVASGVIPAATARRLGLYLRELQHFLRGGTPTIKSNALGHRLGLSDSQIRRDLALFGEFGKRGVGYNVAGLVGALRKALGTDGTWNTVLIGLGNLGNALVKYKGFEQQGFALQAIFESDPAKVGTEIDGVPVYSIDQLDQILPSLDTQMAILAVPADSAPGIADRLVDLGIAGILNFAPVSLSVQKQVATVDVDLAVELQRLAFAVVNSERSS